MTLDKRPTAKEWLLNWFSTHENRITPDDMCFWMPNGLYSSYKRLFDALEELNLQFDDDRKYLVYSPINEGVKQ